jgi:hypothetical protein
MTLSYTTAPLETHLLEVNQTLTPYAALWHATIDKVEHASEFGFAVARRSLSAHHQAFRSKNDRFTVKAKAWILSRDAHACCEVRMVLIEGTANTIINTWAFPFAPNVQPVYAAELIAMAGLPRLTFMDIQVPSMAAAEASRVRLATQSIRQEFEDIHCTEEPPAWAIDATAGNYLFGRGAAKDAFPRIQRCYLELWDAYRDLLASASSHASGGESLVSAQQALAAYQLHHMQHSPGQVFLGKVFGQAWTDDFLNNFLFTPPGE